MSLPGYPAYKESGVPWLQRVPAHWEVIPARRIFGERRDSAFVEDEQLSATQRYGVIPQRLFMEAEDQKVVLALSGTSNFKHVAVDDFVISLRSFQGGIEHSNYEGCVSPAYTVLRAAAPITPRYWAYTLKCSSYISALQTVTAGIREGKNISYSQFGSLELPIPPVEEQSAIASMLDRETAKIDALIAEQETLLALLAEKRQATISHTVTRGLDPDVPMKDSGIAWLGEVPAHWEVCPLKSMVDPKRPIMYGIVLPGPDVGEGIPILKGGNVKPSRMNLESMARTTAEIEAPYARARLVAGDLVYAIRGTIGDCEAVPDFMEGANITQDVARVAVATTDDPAWVRWALLSSPVREELAVGSLGAAVRGVNIIDLKRVKIPRPRLAEQKAIAEAISARVSVFDQLSQEAKSVIELLQERRSALIAAAVTGKIDVQGQA